MNVPPTEWVPCGLCGAMDWEKLFKGFDRRFGLPGEFFVTRCRQCGHLQTNPRPHPRALGFYYPMVYPSHRGDSAPTRRAKRDERFLCWVRRLGFISPFLMGLGAYRLRRLLNGFWRGEGILVDVGCGNGWFAGLAQRVGWRSVGVDISITALSSAQRLWSLPVLEADGIHLPFDDESVSVVVMRHTLEHIPFPDRAVKEAYRVLRPGGHLALEVPNADSLGRKLFGSQWDGWELPRHLHHFTPTTLRRILEGSGFTVVRLRSSVFKPHALLRRLGQILLLPERLIDPFVQFFGLLFWLYTPLMALRLEGSVLRSLARKPCLPYRL